MAKLTFHEKELADYLLKGCKKYELHIALNCTKETAMEILDSMYEKFGVRNIDSLYNRLRLLRKKNTVKDIAKKEWEALYPHDSHALDAFQVQIAWDHWLKAFEVAYGIFEKLNNVNIDSEEEKEEKLSYSQIMLKKQNTLRLIREKIAKMGEQNWRDIAPVKHIELYEESLKDKFKKPKTKNNDRDKTES
jgi:Fe2+ or Zn2+ uptake regulation protein